ncbi:oxysterol-binding protein-related protein 2A-like [Curcuma longa]|uniref:oxysterol-binding protein-related protein 2A-like n=1 Tax=Curcuma longa TaxID=136217 RepID=UPI003D9F1C59
MSSARSMHPLCCIVLDRHSDVGGDRSSDPAPAGGDEAESAPTENGEDVAVAGVLYKWTNYGRGWRSRWFSLRHGVLSYSKIRPGDGVAKEEGGVRIIGDASAKLSARAAAGRQASAKPVGIVYLKVSSFRESKSDDRRFYIFSHTKTLHLKTDTEKDRVAWIQALILARSVYSFRTLSERISSLSNGITFSTNRLRDRMHAEGLREDVIRDCEHIMLSELSEYQRRVKLQYEEHLKFLGTVEQHLEDINTEDEETTCGGHLQLLKTEFSSSGHGKYSEYSTTESSDDVEKQETDDMSDDDEPNFFDTNECFSDNSGSHSCSTLTRVTHHECKNSGSENIGDVKIMHSKEKDCCQDVFPYPERRKKLPEPVEKEKSVGLWSLIKDNVGKDLTRVCLPVYFNEPLSSLQKCFEELEYSQLLDEAYEYGIKGNSLMRILKVAAFAVSAYASSIGRICKPFNPLLGETYEADFPEKGIRFISEKVSHHPMLIACYCEGKGWKFWGDSNLTSKFWGQSIQLDPVGILTLEFDDGEIFQWSKVTTTIYNLIFGKLYCEHHGIMNIKGNRMFSCQLRFKEKSLLDRNPRQVVGFVEDTNKTKVASLMGKWDDSMYYYKEDDVSNKAAMPTENACLLWKRSHPPTDPTRYNLTSFAITLNELTSELQEKLPPTDSRLRPDQRHLENGEYGKANEEKLRLEQRQRMARKIQENGWKPRWFERASEDGTYRYIGGYWEAREQKKWDRCPNIFGEV